MAHASNNACFIFRRAVQLKTEIWLEIPKRLNLVIATFFFVSPSYFQTLTKPKGL
jgi:hypothetical protein